ncbi:hypothetical protein [Larkinella soli]|uniref:hypothetical protein n=1 Tax=Larkinella soli TaxID=1770527 RepID=UPI000FFC58A6|nr:hypothetical protein [Larkinella soli]
MTQKPLHTRMSETSTSGHLTRTFQEPRRPVLPEPPPRRPDWLLILMIGLFVASLLIAWLADIPSLLRWNL